MCDRLQFAAKKKSTRNSVMKYDRKQDAKITARKIRHILSHMHFYTARGQRNMLEIDFQFSHLLP